MTASATHYVYVIRDEAGAALYVGSSGSVGSRLAQHHLKPWFAAATSVTFDRHPSRAEALAAERALIVALRPPHNIVGRDDLPTGNHYETRRLHELGLPCRSDACIFHGVEARARRLREQAAS